MKEIPRAYRVAPIVEELRVEEGDDGWRPITHGGVEVGLLRQTDDGSWTLQCKLEGWERWQATPSRLREGSFEAAEGWALNEIATFIAMREEVELRESRGS